jgi:serine/threonine protein kinase
MVGPWIDVYSVGILLYVLVSGYTPPDPEELKDSNNVKGALKTVNKMTDELADVIVRAMASEYSDRYYDANEVMKAFSKYSDID